MVEPCRVDNGLIGRDTGGMNKPDISDFAINLGIVCGTLARPEQRAAIVDLMRSPQGGLMVAVMYRALDDLQAMLTEAGKPAP
jgi:hypothetical protein